jgi:hypothetical protein
MRPVDRSCRVRFGKQPRFGVLALLEGTKARVDFCEVAFRFPSTFAID